MGVNRFTIEQQHQQLTVALGQGLHWWRQGLLACLPTPLRQSLQRGDRRVWLDVSATGLELHYPNNPDAGATYSWSELADQECQRQLLRQLRQRQSHLRLPGDQVLQRTVNLPMAARRHIRETLGYQMNRWTPFTADQVYYDAQLLTQNPEYQTIKVCLSVVPKSQLQPILQRLKAMHIPVQCIYSDQDHGMNLLPSGDRLKSRRRYTAMNTLLWLLAIVTTVTAFALPLQRQQTMLNDQLWPQVRQAAHQAGKVLDQRAELIQHITLAKTLYHQRHQHPLMLAVLTQLTDILPDSAWLERLTVADQKLILQGEAKSASRLVELLVSSPYFSQVAFLSPVTTDRRTQKDRFQLQAQWQLAKKKP